MLGLLLSPTFLCFLGFAYTLCLFNYRILFCRISHIPVPRLAATTYLHQFYYDGQPHKGQFFLQCERLHARYGPIIRLWPDEVHVNDMAFYNELYTNDIRRHRNKSDLWFWFAGVDTFIGRSVFATLEPDLHRVRRAGFAQYFSWGKVMELQPRIADKAEWLRENVMEWAGGDELLNLTNAMGALTLDAHWMLSGSKLSAVLKRFDKQVHECTRSAFDDALTEGRSKKNNEKRVTVMRDMVGPDGHLPAEERTFARIKNEASNFVDAGIETTGRTLAVTFYHILANPSIHSNLIDELRTVMSFPRSPTPSRSTLEKLPYLTAIITEGLRISHATPGRLARTCPDEDLEFHGFQIPRGPTISQSNYLLHTDAAVFPDPHTFRPERHLAPGAAELQKKMVVWERRVDVRGHEFGLGGARPYDRPHDLGSGYAA
ncbi:hypothetical protein LTR37_017654 [Vermiconidia calcicola]|uniref:Uncharacterized protein n=1 Tax=Vermiconidia calcicola TaxID=1690605 RepID=A0ACC3MKW3_9PEZI|nr:hypothetical protein LTR37_017654 [Vermiconidia calcicola]